MLTETFPHYLTQPRFYFNKAYSDSACTLGHRSKKLKLGQNLLINRYINDIYQVNAPNYLENNSRIFWPRIFKSDYNQVRVIFELIDFRILSFCHIFGAKIQTFERISQCFKITKKSHFTTFQAFIFKKK